MVPYNFKFAFAVVFLVFAGSALCVDYKPGKWDKGPLSCFTCKDSECEGALGEPVKCDAEDDPCVTIFDAAEDKVVARGCASKLGGTPCNDATCFKCVSSKCNKTDSKKDFVECLSCDSSEGDECVTDSTAITTTRKCYKQCMAALYPHDESDEKPRFGLVRSCLDDKKEEDQAICGTSDKNCKSCADKNEICNNFEFPENRLSCFQCEGASCLAAELKPTRCPIYKEDDTCVFIFDDLLKFTKADCKSSLSKEQVMDLEEAGRLDSCKERNCNNPKNKPDVPQCLKCDSKMNEACASDPSEVNTYTSCNFNYCFSQILSDGTTKRGCFKDLDSSVRPKCKEGNEEGCAQCKGDKCNKEVYPNERRKCYKCTTTNDANCEGNPTKSEICPTYIIGNKEKCVTKFNPDTKITERGCRTELKCEDVNPNCEVCHEDTCNTINLKEKHSNGPKPGKWDKGPLSCFTCKDSECEGALGEPVKCDAEDDPCVTIFDAAEDKVVARGCASKLGGTPCNDATCFKCVSSKCNKADSKKDFVECLSCDSSEGDECVTDSTAITTTRKCYKQCMAALYPHDESDEKPRFGLVRSCLDDKKEEDQAICGTSDKNCKSCADKNEICNNFEFPENRLSCFQCEGASCLAAELKPTRCPIYKEDDTCVFIFDDLLKFTKADCKSSLSKEEVMDLEEAGRLDSCKERNCNNPKNKPDVPQCLKCDSKMNEACASDPSEVNTYTSCNFNYCFSQILSDGTTKRGCFKDLDSSVRPKCKEGNEEGCAQCKGDKCNKEVYPNERRKCYKCTTTNDANCEGNPTKSEICPTYIIGNKEKCVTKFNPDTKITERGCRTELKCEDVNPNCEVCHEDTCNTINLKEKHSNGPKPGKWDKGPLYCFTCKDSECEGALGEPVKCDAEDDPCVTIFDAAEDKVVARGCASKLGGTPCNDATCFKCVSSKCNKADSKKDFVECLSCDSSEGDECVTDSTAITTTRKCYKQCMAALYPHDESDEKPRFGLVRSCLDDKKEEDQAICGTSDKNCKSCADKNEICNNFEFPENRLSCFQCEGASCLAAELKPTRCPIYKEDDTCVFIFDDLLKFTKADCKSSLSKEEVMDLEEAGRLDSCKERNCNNPKNKPDVPQCLKCDSKMNEACASDPSEVNTYTSCNFNYCFSQILSDGTTKRGCFKDLDSSVRPKCKEGNEEGCAQCKGDKCNKEVYPNERRKCYKCTTTNDANCEGNPTKSEICPTYIIGNKEKCVTKFNPDTKITERGCRTELKCEDVNPNCEVCHEDTCNTINLKEKHSNGPKPGKWDKGPLYCFTCKDSECEGALGEPVKCDAEDDPCVTIFDAAEDKVVARGCASKLGGTPCNDATCFKCVSSKCNKADSKKDFVECLSCDSSEGDECVTDSTAITTTRKCYKQCMAALYPHDESDEKPRFGLVRSCLDDKKEEDQAICGTSDKNCKSCADKNEICNNFEFPENRLSCFQCEGASCLAAELKPTRCPIYKEDDTCVFIFDDLLKFTKADCKSSLSKEEVMDLEEAGRLDSCKERNCNNPKNKPDVPQCLKCDSKMNEACASDPSEVNTYTSCNFNYCFSQILSDGTTKRGCFKDLDSSVRPKCKEGNEEGCAQCKGDKCNKEVYPNERRKCYKCSTINDPNCEGNPTKSEICPTYIIGNKEKCVTKFNPETKITERGCKTEFPCKSNNQKKCRECNNGDSCNIINLREVNGNDPEPGKWETPPLKCLKCNGENDCKKQIIEADCGVNTDQCVTVFNTAGIVIKRGCATDTKSDCSKEENDCFKCVSTNCNRAHEKTKYKSCLSCDTKFNPKCLSDASSITSKRDCYENCMVALYPRESGPDPSYELVRSCLDDKDEAARKKCNGSDNDCKMCNEDNCNKFLYPENRRKCYQCEGEECKSEVKPSYCPFFKKNDACVFIFNENKEFSAAHCKSTLPNNQIEELERTGRLFSCTEDSCNRLETAPKMPSCLQCDSNDNENCATNPEKLETTVTCNFKYCYSQILENGYTKRGCFSNLDPTSQESCTENSAGLCTQCKEENCNKQIYPANRRKCHRCISTEDEKCEAEPDSTAVCPKYHENDSCVTHFEKEKKVTTRGCVSDLPCDGKDDKKCQVCKNEDSCNTVNLKKANGAMGIYLAIGAMLATLCHLVL